MYHSDFDVVKKKAAMIQATGWNINLNADWLKISRDDPVYILPKFEIHIDSSLGFSVRVFGWLLPDNHQIYIECRRSVRTLTLTNLMHLVSGYNTCKCINRACSTPNGNIKEHIIPKHYKIGDEDYGASTNQDEILRSKACQILVSHQTCSECSGLIQQLTKNKDGVFHEKFLTPAKLNAPISLTSSAKVLLTLQQTRKENKELKSQIKKIEKKLNATSIAVENDLHEDLQKVFESLDKVPPFMKLLWEEQMKYISQSPKQIRYHPAIIRFFAWGYMPSPQLPMNTSDCLRKMEQGALFCRVKGHFEIIETLLNPK